MKTTDARARTTLSARQRAARAGRLTGSRIAPLMTGDAAKILTLWRQMTGQELEPDLSEVWPVQLGIATERLNLDWYQQRRGHQLIRRGEVVVSDDGLFACTLDGWDETDGLPVDAKHVGGHEPLETIIARYQPQMHLQMHLTRARRAALSIVMGASAPVVEFLDFDDAYAREMIRRGQLFMQHVRSRTPPIAVSMPPTVPPQAIRICDMSRSNDWCVNAGDWLTSREASQVAKRAENALKALMPPDARRAHGGGVVVVRDRAGRLSLKVDDDGRELVQK